MSKSKNRLNFILLYSNLFNCRQSNVSRLSKWSYKTFKFIVFNHANSSTIVTMSVWGFEDQEVTKWEITCHFLQDSSEDSIKQVSF